MLTFISNPSAPEHIEIVADEQGIDDLILYLNSIRRNKDHMHLIIGTELDNYPIISENSQLFHVIKSVRLEYFSR
jgi:hypothetical protein